MPYSMLLISCDALPRKCEGCEAQPLPKQSDTKFCVHPAGVPGVVGTVTNLVDGILSGLGLTTTNKTPAPASARPTSPRSLPPDAHPASLSLNGRA